MEAITVQVAKLDMKAGDTLAVMVPQLLHREQREYMQALFTKQFPGMKVAIFDGGITIAQISEQPCIS